MAYRRDKVRATSPLINKAHLGLHFFVILKTMIIHANMWKSHPQFCETMNLAWAYFGVSWPPTLKDIPGPGHGRVFREKFCSVYVVKGV